MISILPKVLTWFVKHTDEGRIGKHPNVLFALMAKYERETGKRACPDGGIEWTDDYREWESSYYENAIKNAGTENPEKISKFLKIRRSEWRIFGIIFAFLREASARKRMSGTRGKQISRMEG